MVAWLVEVKLVATSVVMLAEVDPSVVIVALVEVSCFGLHGIGRLDEFFKQEFVNVIFRQAKVTRLF